MLVRGRLFNCRGASRPELLSSVAMSGLPRFLNRLLEGTGMILAASPSTGSASQAAT